MPNALFVDMELSVTARVVGAAVYSRKNSLNTCRKSMEELAALCHFSVGTVQTCLKKLEERGYLSAEKNYRFHLGRNRRVYAKTAYTCAPVVVMSDTVLEETLALAKEYGRMTGKKVIVAMKERPGFIVNNIFGAITSMAWELLDGGYASFEDSDTAAEKGRWHPMGPIRTMDYSGLDTILSTRKSRYESDPSKFPAPNKILMSKVAKSELGVKSGKGFYEYHK